MNISKLPRGCLEIPKGTNTLLNYNDFDKIMQTINNFINEYTDEDDKKKKSELRAELEDLYFNIILNHTNESIRNGVELDLWNNLFKKPISEYQLRIKNNDKMARLLLDEFLEYANGYYMKIIDTFTGEYELVLPINRVTDDSYTKISDSKAKIEDVQFILQYCLVHIGDFYRYQGLMEDAKRCYEWAVEIYPSFGQAYNQLAIVETSYHAQTQQNIINYESYIKTILLYDYACTCRSPFPATRINLESILRRLIDESVSDLLTSQMSGASQHLFIVICKSWLHIYSEIRLRNNLQRCKQLQQRLNGWITELVKTTDTMKIQSNIWHCLMSISGLQCGLISNYLDQQDNNDSKLWSYHLQMFSQEFIGGICRGLLNKYPNPAKLSESFNEKNITGCLVVFMAWFKQYLTTGSQQTKLTFKYPFAEDFVRMMNCLLNESDILSMDKEDNHGKLPLHLPELNFLLAYQPMNLPLPDPKYKLLKSTLSKENTIKHQASVMQVKSSDIRMAFILSCGKQLAAKYPHLLGFNDSNKQFIVSDPTGDPSLNNVLLPSTAANINNVVASIIPGYFNNNNTPVNSSINNSSLVQQHSSVNRKPVNIALASFKMNNVINNNISVNQASAPAEETKQKINEHSSAMSNQPSVTQAATDIKIAKCIMEQINSTTCESSHKTLSANSMNIPITSNNSIYSESQSYLAPVPGLILSSNLPASYKSQSTTPTESNIALGNNYSTDPIFNQPINSNRLQFQKDLPPRFANKMRGLSQKENNKYTGFNSAGSFTNQNQSISLDKQQTISKLEPNLTMKESEMLYPLHNNNCLTSPNLQPPPSSWLTNNNQTNPSTINNFDNNKSNYISAGEMNIDSQYSASSMLNSNQSFLRSHSPFINQQNFPSQNLNHISIQNTFYPHNGNIIHSLINNNTIGNVTSQSSTFTSTSQASNSSNTPINPLLIDNSIQPQQYHYQQLRQNNPLYNLLPGFNNQR